MRNDRLIAVSSTFVKTLVGYHFVVYRRGGVAFLESDVEWIAGLAIWILIVSLVLYFLSTLVAVARNYRSAVPILFQIYFRNKHFGLDHDIARVFYFPILRST